LEVTHPSRFVFEPLLESWLAEASPHQAGAAYSICAMPPW